jgi:CRISPR-associated protein Csm4
MQAFLARIEVESAFGTPLKGDTLFGQLCWMIRWRLGEETLEHLLDGYADGRPFAVISDAFPAGLALRPNLPPPAETDPKLRKADRAKAYLPLTSLSRPLEEALKDAAAEPDGFGWLDATQPHNSISRLTSTTGNGNDPFQMPRRWPRGPMHLDLHLRLDVERLPVGTLEGLLADIGAWGFGRDASIGLGRFSLVSMAPAPALGAADADSWLTLAPCAPQGGGWDTARSFWKPFVRFGRHGGDAALGTPYKSPVLLADTAAVLTPVGGLGPVAIVGRGLGGDGRISRQIPKTVHQGFAPAIPIRLGRAA